MKTIVFFLLGLIPIINVNAQIHELDDDDGEVTVFDTLQLDEFFNPLDTIELKEVGIYSLKFNNDMEKRYYLWLQKRVRDVWPYARKAVIEYNNIADSVRYFDSKRERRKFIKKRHKQLSDEFEDKLRNLSNSRGQILNKLIYRETNKTSYDIIKELKGSFNAFIWNGLIGAYDINLKQAFEPTKTREDFYIEVILQKDFKSGRLLPVFDDF